MEPTTPDVQLLTPQAIREIARALGIRPTKTLGQNFVHDAGTVRRIVAAADLPAGTHILEVGPGLGSLTLALLEAGMRVSAVEIDPLLAANLPATVAARTRMADRVRVIHADALSITGCADLGLEEGDAPRALVANLPYNVSVPVLLSLLEAFPSIERALVMVQREVAERLCASAGSRTYGVPSAKLAWYGQAKSAGLVGRTVFWPEPHVDSALVSFTRTDHYDPAERENTFAVIDHAFAQRRKSLRKALSGLLGGVDEAARVLAAAGIDPLARGETLTIEDYRRLAHHALPGRRASAHAQGKVNLLLEVGRADERGYHPLRSVFFGLDLVETVTLTPLLGEETRVRVRACAGDLARLEGLADRDNLAVRAVRAALERSHRRAGFALDIDKRVPVAGGMAGGSADAAAALRAARAAFDLPLGDDDLVEIARSLGADVPFGLVGGAAWGTGYGDEVSAIADAQPRHLALAFLEEGLSTPAVFAAFDAGGGGREHLREELGDEWAAALADPDPSALAGLIHNDLADAALALRPDLQAPLEAARAAGALSAFVSGSGPTIAALGRDGSHARCLAEAMAQAPGVSATRVVSGPHNPREV